MADLLAILYRIPLWVPLLGAAGVGLLLFVLFRARGLKP